MSAQELLAAEVERMRAAGRSPATLLASTGVLDGLGAVGRSLIVNIADGKGGRLDWTLLIVTAPGVPEPMMQVFAEGELVRHEAIRIVRGEASEVGLEWQA